jgi:hypothetical protein
MGDAAWLVEVGWVRPQVWRPPVEPSRLEGAVMARDFLRPATGGGHATLHQRSCQLILRGLGA